MLALIRIPVVLVAFLVLNVLVLIVCVARPFHRDNVYIAGQLYSQIAKLLGLKITIRRPEGLDTDKSYVVVANHQNSYDIITICKAAFPGVVTIGKKSLKWIPIFGQMYWLSGNIMIDRKNTAKALDTLQLTAKKITEKNLSVWFFPEGTRSYGRGILPFKVGAFRLAIATETPVIMVTASNLHEKIKWNRWNNGEMIIDIGQPSQLDNSRSPKGWMAHYHGEMEKKFAELNDEVAQSEKSI
ncbi:1-acylglycerol-3-phosphate O-acyltransferase [Alteromonas lipolytica]|uniref:1-acyl-sn-glycerol-3-phosphate acyltransferase n=1 Tax=Alteromonas lipolytica TaxID=1856405 RepID=A0A1E8FAX6_9ALTE|nr:1-acylglycerol-3-phosphate O-acyltransferase [Alteromonas lipolytica]OFI32758.1 acyl-phosphate glycerol 3-phosphate acyltransferase [Alteromonas lipolytica]GGF73320.1 1-acyl-sn-glycerol-3-phosphate acyltransferase [Alteromonas lipolytica]